MVFPSIIFMGLEDKFYPDDGTLLRRFDNFMIKKVGKVAEHYQNWSGKTQREILKGVYRQGIVAGLMSTPVTLLGGPVAALLNYTLSRNINNEVQSPLEEKNQHEIEGPHPQFGPFFRTAYTLGTIACGALSALLIIDPPYLTVSTLEKFSMIMGTMSFTTLTLGQYISKYNMPEPPEEPVKDKIKDAITFRKPLEPIFVTPSPGPRR